MVTPLYNRLNLTTRTVDVLQKASQKFDASLSKIRENISPTVREAKKSYQNAEYIAQLNQNIAFDAMGNTNQYSLDVHSSSPHDLYNYILNAASAHREAEEKLSQLEQKLSQRNINHLQNLSEQKQLHHNMGELLQQDADRVKRDADERTAALIAASNLGT